MSDVQFPEPLDPMDRAMQRMDKKAWAEADAEIATLKARLAEAERDAARLKERLEEATDLLGFAEIRLLAFGQHRSANPDYVLAMDAIKLFLLTADSAKEGK